MNKLLHGLDMFHIAGLTSDSKEGVVFETPEHLPGAVSISVKPNTDSNPFYADNGVYAVLNSIGETDVEMEIADLPLTLQKKIFGQTEENGVNFSSIDDIAIELALGFRARISTGGYRFYWLLKGKPELLPIDTKTDEGNTTPQTVKLALKFMNLQYNGRWMSVADSSLDIDSDKWFQQVVYEGAVLPITP